MGVHAIRASSTLIRTASALASSSRRSADVVESVESVPELGGPTSRVMPGVDADGGLQRLKRDR
jgi:hypothetical protein